VLGGRLPAHPDVSREDRALAVRLDRMNVLVLAQAFDVSPRSTAFTGVLRRWAWKFCSTKGPETGPKR
jgi:hypothetical protein